MSRSPITACICAGSLLLGARAVTTADVYLPIAGGSESLLAEFHASVVSSEGQTTVFAMTCPDGVCNPTASGPGTLIFTAAPDTFIFSTSLQGQVDIGIDLQCTIKGCPSITDVECVTSMVADGETSVGTGYRTNTERFTLSLDHEVDEPTPVECPSTSAPEDTGSAGDGEQDEEDSGDGKVNSEDEDEDGEGLRLANVPVLGLVAGAAIGVAAVLL